MPLVSGHTQEAAALWICVLADFNPARYQYHSVAKVLAASVSIPRTHTMLSALRK
jgi:hypothetical protein